MRRSNDREGIHMMNRTALLIAAVVLALALAWYAVPLPEEQTPMTPPAATAPTVQPVTPPGAQPAPPAATEAAPPTETPKQ